MTELSGYLQRMLDTSTIYSSGCDWSKHFHLKIMVRKKETIFTCCTLNYYLFYAQLIIRKITNVF